MRECQSASKSPALPFLARMSYNSDAATEMVLDSVEYKLEKDKSDFDGKPIRKMCFGYCLIYFAFLGRRRQSQRG